MRRTAGWLLAAWIGLALMSLTVAGLAGSGPRALAQAAVTATPRPDGSIVHTVQEGDTLFGLALLYGTTVDEIRALNGLDSDLLIVGQELLIRPPQAAPAAPSPTPAPVARQPGALCTGAFEDRNGNDQKEEGEPWIAGVRIALVNGRGFQQTLISRAGQPACARDLEPGYYLLALDDPAGYQASGSPRREVWLPWNAEVTLLFGLRPAAASPAPTPSPAPAAASASGLDLTRLGEALLLAAGFLALLLAGGAIGYWVGQRRARPR
jgi:LysM repeat protein